MSETHKGRVGRSVPTSYTGLMEDRVRDLELEVAQLKGLLRKKDEMIAMNCPSPLRS